MRAPAFWSYERPGLVASMLMPFALLYNQVVIWRYRNANCQISDIPVICVGNFVAGGAGKTPTALALADLLVTEGHNPAFLSRGYGGKDTGPTLVDLETATSRQFGDEPLLLARKAPTIVSTNRPDGARLAVKSGADVIILDDGLQNPSLKKTVSLAVVDGLMGLGNGAVIPAGPLRASLDFQLGLIDAIILVGDGDRTDDLLSTASRHNISVIRAKLTPQATPNHLEKNKFVAYAGIGFPEKFFNTLERAGVEIIARVSFPDHHQFTNTDARYLLELANEHRADLMTTEKDFVRLQGRKELAKLRNASLAYPVTLEFEDPEFVMSLISRKIQR